MLSYKKWKSLNESFDCTLGVAQRPSLGVSSNVGPTLDEFMALLDEKKKMKKKMLGEKPFGGDDETGDGEMVEPSSLKDKKIVDKDMGDDDDDMDDDDMGDEDNDMDDADDGGDIDLKGLKGDKLMMMKKKMKKKMGAGCKKKMKKEEVEEAAPAPVDDPWLQSVANMFKGDLQKHWDGFSPLTNEDSLIPATDPNKGLVDEQPQPGEVGYAPQGRVGEF